MADDREKLQGRWYVTGLESDGQTKEPTEFDSAIVLVEDDQFTSLGMGLPYKGTFEIDQSTKPKTLDMTFTAGHATGVRHLGIYKLTGDRWTMCLAPRNGDRPEKFATLPGSGFVLETLERSPGRKSTRGKSRAQSMPASPSIVATPTGKVSSLEGEWAMVSAVFNGAPMADEMVQWVKRVTRGNVTSVVAGPQTMLKATFTIDESKTPHAIDYTNTEGPNRGKSQAGVFESNGDTLRICMAAPGNARPSDFSSKSKDGRSFTTWRRVKS